MFNSIKENSFICRCLFFSFRASFDFISISWPHFSSKSFYAVIRRVWYAQFITCVAKHCSSIVSSHWKSFCFCGIVKDVFSNNKIPMKISFKMYSTVFGFALVLYWVSVNTICELHLNNDRVDRSKCKMVWSV